VNTRTRESGKPATRCKGAGFPRGGCGLHFLTHGLPVKNPTTNTSGIIVSDTLTAQRARLSEGTLGPKDMLAGQRPELPKPLLERMCL
jgi:hypothetical protein